MNKSKLNRDAIGSKFEKTSFDNEGTLGHLVGWIPQPLASPGNLMESGIFQKPVF